MFQGDRLRNLRQERNMTQIELAHILCVGNNTVSRYETGEREPDSETFVKITELFEISADYLLGRTPNRHGMPVKAESKNTVPIPVLGVIRAGAPIVATEAIEEYVLVTPAEAANGEYFYLRVIGDSMCNARICDGDLVYVRRQDCVDDRDIAVVMVDGENATIKRVIYADSGIILQPESSNSAHKALFFPAGSSDLRVIGRVMHVKFTT